MEILYDNTPINTDYMQVGHDLNYVSWGQEAAARFAESYTRAPTSSIDRWMEMGEAEIEDSPYLSEEEWKESPYYREGLKFPDGVKQSVAQLVADRKDQERRSK